MKRELELRDICGYLPHQLKIITNNGEQRTISGLKIDDILYCTDGKHCVDLYYIKTEITPNCKPILRPLDDLYKTIKHNGKEVVPIVELAKIACPCLEWELWKNIAVSSDRDDGFITAKIKWEESEYYFSYTKEDGAIKNLPQLFDYLHELKIDYRGLIDEGLAVSVYDFENEIYN